MSRSYQDAIASINTLQSNAALIAEIRRTRRPLNTESVPDMRSWIQKIGHETDDLNRLNVIHIAGTKGKGSTSAFISSILAQYRDQNGAAETTPLRKIGLYTSPHLRSIRERIQINNEPLTEEQFTRYFFDTWDRLEDFARRTGQDAALPSAKPMYFRFLTLMAFHTYISEGVDVAIIECGIGGEYDCTNVITHPTVCGISRLGIDHVMMLGNSIEEISWHKAGIMKTGTKCFTVEQKTEALEVLERRAREKQVSLDVVPVHPEIEFGAVQLGLSADFQKSNASLAIAIAQHFLTERGMATTKADDALNERFRKGLLNVKWGGRCETRTEKDLTWYIDGGHTSESLDLTGKWFVEQLVANFTKVDPGKQTRILIFNQQTRDAASLVQVLYESIQKSLPAAISPPFTHAIFCTNTTFESTGFSPELMNMNSSTESIQELTVQKALAKKWEETDSSTEVRVVGTIEEAVRSVRALIGTRNAEGGDVMALVTGSLHLVGGLLEVMESNIDRK